jgi:hypothetical protein
LFDRRRGAKWIDFVIVIGTLLLGGAGLVAALGPILAVAVFGTLLAFGWSMMRLAAGRSVARLDDRLCDLPCIGRIYETLFHPDTYFRQDQCAMYQEAVQRAVMKALADLTNLKGLRPLTESESKPRMYDLHRR